MSLKVWDGSAFTDGEPTVWNGSAFVDPASAWVWDGSEFIQVWPAAPSPVEFDAVAAGASGTSSSMSWSHTAAEGAFVLVAIQNRALSPAVNSVTYDGNAMTLLGSVNSGSNTTRPLYLYGLSNVGAGTKTVIVTLAATPSAVSATSMSYTHVAAAGTPAYVSGAVPADPSQTVSCTPGQRIVQVFGVASGGFTSLTSLSGGTNRYNDGANTTKVCVSDADTSTTFSADATGGDWGGIAVVLSP